MATMTTHPVYQPDEDTLFFNETLKKILADINEKTFLLDMGAGSGYLGFEALKNPLVQVTFADINSLAINHITAIKNAEDLPVNILHSDLFSTITSTFDIILFNTPYLPFEDDQDVFDPSIHGGKDGNEVTLRFIDDLNAHLNPQGKAILLFSSLSNPEIILSKAKENGFETRLLAQKNLFFEQLFIYSLTKEK
ncbi:MAG: HemK2/MTQ2 family protein methyltransferase [Nanobdellota archaeon]